MLLSLIYGNTIEISHKIISYNYLLKDKEEHYNHLKYNLVKNITILF